MADELYLPQVDYTSRDYTAIRADLISLIPNFAPNWTSRESTDFGIVLLELFSYIGDVLNYNIDRAANEAFINTATQRETVLQLSRLLNYIPTESNPASGSVTLSNTTNNPIQLYGTNTKTTNSPAVFTTKSDGINPSVSFTLDKDVFISAAVGTTPTTITATVTQGSYISSPGESVGTSDGTANQEFTLANTGVMPDSTFVLTVGGAAYTRVAYTIDYGQYDSVYSLYTNGDGITRIKFGDGTSGRIPPNGSAIVALYRYSNTAGTLGNIGASYLTESSVPGITVTNDAAFSGGVDPETTDSIRVNAPLSLRSTNRPVSLKDYSNLAIQVAGVLKANAIASNFNSVVLYIGASGGAASSTALKTNVSNYFKGKTPPGTTLSVQDFTPSYPFIKITVTVLSQYNAVNVGNAVSKALYTLLAYDNVTFNDAITQGDIYSAVKAVDGVSFLTINDMQKFTSIYSGTATVGTASAGTTAVKVINNSGIWTSPTSKISAVNGNTADSRVGLNISALNTIYSSAIAASNSTTVIVGTTSNIPVNSVVNGTGIVTGATVTTTPTIVNATSATITGTGTGGASTITLSATTGVQVGMSISGSGVATAATIVSIASLVATVSAPNATTVSGNMTIQGTSLTLSATTSAAINSGQATNAVTVTTSNSTDLILATTATNTTLPTFSANDVITIENSVGSVSDLTFNINEIPILSENYIKVVTTGGS
jgi:hypothetical protein